jgi:hypothetical protein
MPHRFLIRGLVLAACLLLALAVSAEAQDLTGDWDFTVEVPGTCTWMGPATFAQTGGVLTGSGNLALTAGSDPPCPPALLGTANGTVAGQTVMFGLTTLLGDVDFSGLSDPAGSSLSGTWTLGTLAGSWSATRVETAPSLPEWGMIALLSALLAGGIYSLRRRRSSLL